ncbi:MAG: hypothetical protein IJ681_00695 [Bacteroidales bacterium]|nr:hypothetical protein [Bacteroidales bacterium]
MSKAIVIPFKAEHVEVMDVRDYELNTTFTLANVQTALKVFEMSKKAGTIICEGRVIAIMGVQDLWPGVCELWVLPSKYLHEYVFQFSRTILKAMNSGILNGYHRIQIRATDDELHNRWLKFLKFEKEGTLRKYDNLGNDMNIWARVKE